MWRPTPGQGYGSFRQEVKPQKFDADGELIVETDSDSDHEPRSPRPNLQSVDSRREAKPKKAVTQVTNTTTPIDPQAKTTIAKAETIVPFPHTDPKEESAKTQPREKATKNPDPKTPSPKKRRRAKKAAKKMAKTRCADMGSDKSVEKGANQDVEMDINKGTEKGPEMMIIERL